MAPPEDIITFKVAEEEDSQPSEDSSDYCSPYIHLADPAEDISKLLNAEDIVIPKPKICLAVGYPFRQDYLFMLRADNPNKGFARKELALKISQLYQDVYEVEARTAPNPGSASAFLYNRGESHGQYGIVGHDLDDLLLHNVSYDAAADVYRLGVDS